MPLVASAALMLALLIVCCFAPGFFFIRRLRWTPMEKLCGSIGLSVMLLYLVTWFTYLGGNGLQISAGVLELSSIACALLGLASGRDLLRLFHSFQVKRALLGYAFLFLWVALLLGMVRVYSGALWAGDWLEHFQRTLFFLWRFPANTSFTGRYTLPARPPLMNVVAAYFLAQTQDRFELFQLVFSFLNLLIFFPCCLILPVLAKGLRQRTLPLMALFALNPMVMENVTYAWTKALTGFFVLLGLAFYLAAWRRRDPLRMLASFVFLVAGILAHYSAGPYVVFLTLHYALWLFWRRPNKWKEMTAILAICTALLATWFAWSIKTYGAATFVSNTTVTTSQEFAGGNAEKILANIYDSLVPFVMRDWSLMSAVEQPNSMGKLRDGAFLVYQTNIILGMGLVGGPLVVWHLLKRFRRKGWRRTPESTFWFLLILVCTILGIVVVGEREEFGSAHLTMLTLEVLGLALLTNILSKRRILATVLLAGCLVDFSLGVFLHAHIQSLENDSAKAVFTELEFSNSQIRPSGEAAEALSRLAWINWYNKHALALSNRWLEELPKRHGKDPAFQSIWPAAKASLLETAKADTEAFGGWYSRHGGEIQYIGDHLSGAVGEAVVPATLLAVLAALILTLIRQMPPVHGVPPNRQPGPDGPRRGGR